MFLTLDKEGKCQEYTWKGFANKFGIKKSYLSDLYNEETFEISDENVKFLADWYDFNSDELLAKPSNERYLKLRDYPVIGLLSSIPEIIEEGIYEEFSCGNEAMSYGNIVYIYSDIYKFKEEVRYINAFDIRANSTIGLFRNLEKQTDLKIFIRS